MESNEGIMRVEIPGAKEIQTSPRGPSHGLTRQQSYGSTKGNCLCSPTTHAGSFRCRLHRAPSFQRTKSMDPSTTTTCSKTGNSDDSSNSNFIQAQ